ncbi:MAG: hypothetical protein ACJ72T_08510 [Nitrososphaeraceae archaeon]
MKIHIQRRHASMLGEGSLRSQLQSPDSQLFSNIGNSLYKTNNDYLKDNYNYSYIHQEDPPSSKNYYHNDPQFFQEQGQSQEQEENSLSKMRNNVRDIYEAMYLIAEINNIAKQFRSSSSPGQSLPAISNFVRSSLTGINPTEKLIKHYTESIVLDTMFRYNKNIGFRGHTCNNCFACWVDPIYSNSEDITSLIKSTKPSSHMCDPRKVADAKNIQDIQSSRIASENTLISLLVFLIFIYTFYFPQNKICLRTEEFTSSASCSGEFDLQRQSNNRPSELGGDSGEEQQQHYVPNSRRVQREEINCNSVDIDLTKVEKSHWTYRAITEAMNNGTSSIVMHNNELMDFVETIKGSYGIRTAHIDGSTRHFCMYLSFKDVL